MGNVVTSHKHIDGIRNVVMTFTGVGDGSGVQETLVKKVDATLLLPPAIDLRIRRIKYNVFGGLVRLYWDATTPLEFINFNNNSQDEEYPAFGGLRNDAGLGKTGSILLSTNNFVSGSSYSITLEMAKDP